MVLRISVLNSKRFGDLKNFLLASGVFERKEADRIIGLSGEATGNYEKLREVTGSYGKLQEVTGK